MARYATSTDVSLGIDRLRMAKARLAMSRPSARCQMGSIKPVSAVLRDEAARAGGTGVLSCSREAVGARGDS